MRVACLADAVTVPGCGVDDRFSSCHAARDLCKRRKALAVESRVVDVVDKDLARASVRAGGRIRDIADAIGLKHWVIWDLVLGSKSDM